jgi:hypothetical protein
LNALYLVHGGSDGLVQAWDPLASRTERIRTISGRPTGRFRKQVVRNGAMAMSLPGFPTASNYNQFAVQQICLDPDSTVLRGVATIGSVVRSWQYRSQNIEQRTMPRPGNKRKKRRGSERHGTGNVRVRGFSGPQHIRQELAEVKQDLNEANAERKHLEKRFGLGVFGEQEEMQLAMAMSQETFQVESQSSSLLDTPLFEVEDEGASRARERLDQESRELAEALQQSLAETSIRSPSPKSPVQSTSWSQVAARAGTEESVEEREQREFEMALKMSLMETGASQDEGAHEEDGFPSLPEREWKGSGKGKDRA